MKTIIKTSIKTVLLTVVCGLMLHGCASLNPFSFLEEKPQLEVNANVGKNVNQDKATVKVETGKTEQTADRISNDTKNVYTAGTVNQIAERIPPYIIILLVLAFGWCIPDPTVCYKGVKYVIGDIANHLIITPIRAVANFILALFGRNKTSEGPRESN